MNSLGYNPLRLLAYLKAPKWYRKAQGRVVRRSVNAYPGLKVNQSINFSCLKLIITSYLLRSLRLLKLKTEGLNIEKKISLKKIQYSNQNYRLSWVSLFGLWATRPRAKKRKFWSIHFLLYNIGCDKPLGLQSGWVKNSQIRASSIWSKTHAAWRGRLHMPRQYSYPGAWIAKTNNVYQWIQVREREIAGW